MNTGGPAFPYVYEDRSLDMVKAGMTLRDYFAAAALQGLCATFDQRGWQVEFVANSCYALADAMLREREK